MLQLLYTIFTGPFKLGLEPALQGLPYITDYKVGPKKYKVDSIEKKRFQNIDYTQFLRSTSSV